MEMSLEEAVYLPPYVNGTMIEKNIMHNHSHRQRQAENSSWTDDEIQEDSTINPEQMRTVLNNTVTQTATQTSKKSDGIRLLSIAKRLEKEEKLNQNKLLELRKHLIEALTLVEKELQGRQTKKRKRWQKFIFCK